MRPHQTVCCHCLPLLLGALLLLELHLPLLLLLLVVVPQHCPPCPSLLHHQH
jgi:hypothetical protein